MRDGVCLATDIFRPALGDKLPTILIRTTYNKDDVEKTLYCEIDIDLFADHGYAIVIQDIKRPLQIRR